MTVLELVRTIARAEAPSSTGGSLSGTLVFCGIGLLLGLAAMLFGWLGQPAAMMF